MDNDYNTHIGGNQWILQLIYQVTKTMTKILTKTVTKHNLYVK